MRLEDKEKKRAKMKFGLGSKTKKKDGEDEDEDAARRRKEEGSRDILSDQSTAPIGVFCVFKYACGRLRHSLYAPDGCSWQ